MQNGLPFWYVREPALRSVDPQGAHRAVFSRRANDRRRSCTFPARSSSPATCARAAGCATCWAIPPEARPLRVDALVGAFASAGLAAETDTNIRQTVWLKLVNNIGLNAVSALRGMKIKPMLADAARAPAGCRPDA